MDYISTMSEDLIRKLDCIKMVAETAEKGTIFFLEVSSQPLISLVLVTSDNRTDTIHKKSVHLEYKPEPSTYPSISTTQSNPYITGYNKYKLLEGAVAPQMDLDSYISNFESVCCHINSMIMKNHGVVCYQDGNKLNKNTNNVFYIHICDAMNLIVRNLEGEVPDLVVKTNLLKELPQGVVNDFEDSFVEKCQKDFFLKHVDYFYTTYAYFGNYSFIPIRSLVTSNSSVFKKSSFFTNDEHFIDHQKGKLMEFNRINQRTLSRMLYRSI